MKTDQITVALAGNPNAGKTSLFNALTRSDHHVGNWPGKTVEKRYGTFEGRISIVDLPGAYSLGALSAEESVSRDVLLNEEIDVVVMVVDATNIERNLYLATQVLEIGKPTVVVLNMCDSAESRGLVVNDAILSRRLRAPVVRTVACRGEGVTELIEAIDSVRKVGPLRIDYGEVLEPVLGHLTSVIEKKLPDEYPARWLAVELIDNGEDLRSSLREKDGGSEVIAAADAAAEGLREKIGDSAWVAVADRRYSWIHEVVAEAVTNSRLDLIPLSDRIDRWATHRLFGLPIFMFVAWVLFKFTADVSVHYVDWVDQTVNGPISRWGVAALARFSLDGTVAESLWVDGLTAGVGGVLVFVPVLVTLFVCLAVLEDSGYMARAALVMDRVMIKLGLPGKSFIPMLVGFGCTVPAIYATRTLENKRDRILTGLLVPFMSCGARLPVYVLFAAVFFPHQRGLVVFSMYLLGVLAALAVGALLGRTVFGGEPVVPLVMELPSYRIPTMRSVWRYTKNRTGSFLKNAGTLIFATSMVVWLLMAIPVSNGGFADVEVENSAFGFAAETISPVFEPAGFGSWEAAGSLVAGFVAKEVVVSSLAQSYGATTDDPVPTDIDLWEDMHSIGSGLITATADTLRAIPSAFGVDLRRDSTERVESGLMESIRASFVESSDGHGSAAALAFLVFVLLYTPCMAAAAAERSELGAKWMWASIIGQTGLAWLVATLVFQMSRVLGGW